MKRLLLPVVVAAAAIAAIVLRGRRAPEPPSGPAGAWEPEARRADGSAKP